MSWLIYVSAVGGETLTAKNALELLLNEIASPLVDAPAVRVHSLVPRNDESPQLSVIARAPQADVPICSRNYVRIGKGPHKKERRHNV